MISVTLPWPPRECSPNARVHWATKARAAQQARTTAHWLAIEASTGKMDPKPINVTITFCEPDRRRRDMDGMLSQSKNMLDGIADAIGVDDHLWSLSLRRGDVRKGGAVVVEIDGGP